VAKFTLRARGDTTPSNMGPAKKIGNQPTTTLDLTCPQIPPDRGQLYPTKTNRREDSKPK